jgi:sugar lactone lactonase YvrE
MAVPAVLALLVALAALPLAAPALTGERPLGARVRAFASPGDYPEGLAWDGTHLWSNNFTNGTLYRIDPSDGQVVGSYTGGGLPSRPEGLCWDGARLWTCDWVTGRIMRVRVEAQAVVVEAAFDKPPGAGNTVGLEWDGTSLWLSCFGPTPADKSELWELDPQTLAVRHFVRLPVWYVEDLAWDGYNLWSVDWMIARGFAIDRTSGDTLHTYRTPGPNPVGQAWDGEYLWISSTTADSIWAVDISAARPPTAIAPATWTQLKQRYGARR